jgi:multisubunit Na+/H+ antiporter MnhG subunit
MLKDISRNRIVGLWFTAVAVIIAFVVAMGVNVAVSTTAFLLTLSLVPPAIMLLLWRAAPPPTVAEILHAASSPKEGRS